VIHRISANKRTFHPIDFKAGLNVIVAERTKTSSQKDTRNGLGKSTLIQIIDFCLGSRVKNGEGLFIDPLADWAFTIEITLGRNRIKATRSFKAPGRVVIEGSTSGWIEQPDFDEKNNEYILNLERWKNLLGSALFGLNRTNDALKYKPTYRSLISYFLRTSPDAYIDQFRHFRLQQTWDIQVNIGYILGLNWELASRWQDLRDQEAGIKAMESAIKTGALEGLVGTLGELETERVQLETRLEEETKSLSSFKVHPQYADIQKEADELTGQIHSLNNLNVVDRRKLSRYKESIESETPPTEIQIESIYKETGLVFPDALKKTLDEAKDFHKKLIQNRKSFLGSEINNLERQIASREEQIKRVSDKRAASLQVLNTYGALQEFVGLQGRFVEAKERLEKVKGLINSVKDMTKKKREIKVSKVEMIKTMERDHEERRDQWASAVRNFGTNSKALYESPGKLVINILETGYEFQVEIPRSDSEGIGKMKVFCFDLMLSQLMHEKKGLIDFLIHDSIIYDGVDSRQRALALERAAIVSEKDDTQYICTLNSDMIPMQDFSKGFNFDNHVRLTLTDRDITGSLLGIQF
jgi:uncharacterized protein YydD (DUF2326 family)